MSYKIIVAGGRKFDDYKRLKKELDEIIEGLPTDDIEIVCGGANGADALGARYARNHGYKIKRFIPDWEGIGKCAGYVRNKQMANYADCLVAFWDTVSNGTRNMIKLSEDKGLDVYIRLYE